MCALASVSSVTEPYTPWRLRREDVENTTFKMFSEILLNVFKEAVAGKEATPYLRTEEVDQCLEAIKLLDQQLVTALEAMWEESFSLNSGALIRWVDLSTKGEEESSEFRIERKVIGTFEGIGQVFSIYTDEYLQRKRFLILTTNEKYDDELMDRLLVAERDVRLQFKDVPLSFEYIPRLIESLDQIFNPNVRLIWSRNLDGVSTGSFATSTT